MTFSDTLKQLPAVASIAQLHLYDEQKQMVGSLENKPGQAGSVAVYHYLFETFGAITPQAAEKGLALYAEHAADAQQNPGKHPNIDRLITLIDRQNTLNVEVVRAS
jgi:hypothetical protein